ncbi:radial spoke head protein 9 homolog isoform X3 [Gallus gallus]|uniref:radial spoke head protein 9 homolog isoform X3 n=1 Tax=Gallus gallus TaxID=9031 RepID=UPI001EFF9BD7|nr:radial spoke head protein 9 homolog isoform X3 [Gallus gallus]
MEPAALPTALQLAASGDTGLSLEKRAALGASLLLLQRDYRFERVWFWGCIQGVRGTYYIAQGLGPDLAAPRSRLYSLNCVEWSLLPPATVEMVEQAALLKGLFQGDPSFEYEYAEVNAEDDERFLEDGKELTIKEENRLVATIEQIDRAVGIIPRRAFMKTPLGSVHENRNFEGLSLTEAKKLSSYFHFTEPVNLKNKTLLEKADLDPSTDFLDSLEHDVPQGWKIKHICQPKTILGRTLITDMENMKIYLQGEKARPVVKNINVLYLLDPGRMHKLGILKWMWKKCTCLPTTAMHFLLQITDSTDFKNISFW